MSEDEQLAPLLARDLANKHPWAASYGLREEMGIRALPGGAVAPWWPPPKYMVITEELLEDARWLWRQSPTMVVLYTLTGMALYEVREVDTRHLQVFVQQQRAVAW